MSMREDLMTRPVPWTSGQGPESDVILSTRVRLARNFAGQRFPNRIDREEAMQVWKHLLDFSNEHQGYAFYRLDQVNSLDKQALVAMHLISREHAADNDHFQALVIKNDLSESVMINEEDHLRIQAFAPGLATGQAWQAASALDDAIGSYSPYAFNPTLGYLTACPTNLGTGLRVSLMLHLPAMVASRKTGFLQQAAGMGMTVRGFFGEGSRPYGDLFQLSNQLTLGRSEEDLLANVLGVAKHLAAQERQLRQGFLENEKAFTDRCYRALGTLSFARLLPSAECYELLSLVRLGVCLGLIKEYTLEQINPLFLCAHPGYIQFLAGKPLDAASRDAERARIIRNKITAL